MKNKLQQLINQSRKDQDNLSLGAYQAILSSIQEREGRENVNLSNEQIFGIIQKEAKIFQESAGLYADKSPETSRNYTIQKELCEGLLPQQIAEEEYRQIADDCINFVGAESMRDMGKVMAAIKGKYGMSLDIGKISGIVKQKLRL